MGLYVCACLSWPGAGLMLLVLSQLLPPLLPHLALATLAAILLANIIFTPNIELFVRLWTFDRKRCVLLLPYYK